MTNRLLLLLVSFLLSVNTFAKDKEAVANLKGSVKDEKGTAVISATVALHRLTDSSLVKTEITNTAGVFEFQALLNGNYFIRVSAMGSSNYESAPLAVDAGQQLELPAVLMQPLATELGG